MVFTPVGIPAKPSNSRPSSHLICKMVLVDHQKEPFYTLSCLNIYGLGLLAFAEGLKMQKLQQYTTGIVAVGQCSSELS